MSVTQGWTGRFWRVGAMIVGLAAVMGGLMGANTARAGEGVSPAIMARFHFAEGEKAEKAGQHPKAVEDFEKALAITKAWPSPEMRLSYAHALVRTGRHSDALREADAYLADPGRSRLADDTAQRIRLEANPPKPGIPEKIESVTLDLGDGVTMTLNRIPAGQFAMGSPPTERDRNDNELQRAVTITKPFYLGIHQVTQLQWLAIMGTTPSHFSGFDLPVEMVSWNDAVAFCINLSAMTGRKGSVSVPNLRREGLSPSFSDMLRSFAESA